MGKTISKYHLPPKPFASTKDRLVYNIGSGMILKKARTKEGEQDNQTEVRLYKETPPSLKKYLAKIIDYGPGWMVMEKAITPLPKNKAANRIVSDIVDKFERAGIQARDILTSKHKKAKRHNLGLNKKGQIIVIDYGKFIDTRRS